MSDIQERSDFVSSQLLRIHSQVSDDYRARGADRDSTGVVILIGVALLLRAMDEADGIVGQSNSRLSTILDQGRSSIAKAILDSLTGSKAWNDGIWNELFYMMEVEVRDFEDERIRFILKRVEKLEVPGVSLGEKFLLGRAFQGLIELLGSRPIAINSSVTRFMAALAGSSAENLVISDPFFGGGFLPFEVAFQAVKAGGNHPVIEGKTPNKGLWVLSNLLGLVYGFDCQIEVGDSIRNPASDSREQLKTYDMVISSPSLGVKIPVGETFDKYNRFAEMTQSSEWMALQHIVATLSERGKAVVLTGPSVLFSKGAGARIRTQWIQEDILESVITLPVGMWQPVTNVAPVILVFNKNKAEDNRRTIFFLQIEGDEYIGTVPKMRGRKILREEGIPKILEQFRWAQEDRSYLDTFSQVFRDRVFWRRSASIEQNGCDLRLQQFFEEEKALQRVLVPFILNGKVIEAMKSQREAEACLDHLLQKHFHISLKEKEYPPESDKVRAKRRAMMKKHQAELDENG